MIGTDCISYLVFSCEIWTSLVEEFLGVIYVTIHRDHASKQTEKEISWKDMSGVSIIIGTDCISYLVFSFEIWTSLVEELVIFSLIHNKKCMCNIFGCDLRYHT